MAMVEGEGARRMTKGVVVCWVFFSWISIWLMMLAKLDMAFGWVAYSMRACVI